MREGQETQLADTSEIMLSHVGTRRSHSPLLFPEQPHPSSRTERDFWSAGERDIPSFVCSPWDFYEKFIELHTGAILVLCNDRSTVRAIQHSLVSRDLFALPIIMDSIQIYAIAAGGTLCIFAFVNLLPLVIPLITRVSIFISKHFRYPYILHRHRILVGRGLGQASLYSWPTSQSTCSTSSSYCRGTALKPPTTRPLAGERALSQRSTRSPSSPGLILPSSPTYLGSRSRPSVASTGRPDG